MLYTAACVVKCWKFDLLDFPVWKDVLYLFFWFCLVWNYTISKRCGRSCVAEVACMLYLQRCVRLTYEIMSKCCGCFCYIENMPRKDHRNIDLEKKQWPITMTTNNGRRNNRKTIGKQQWLSTFFVFLMDDFLPPAARPCDDVPSNPTMPEARPKRRLPLPPDRSATTPSSRKKPRLPQPPPSLMKATSKAPAVTSARVAGRLLKSCDSRVEHWGPFPSAVWPLYSGVVFLQIQRCARYILVISTCVHWWGDSPWRANRESLASSPLSSESVPTAVFCEAAASGAWLDRLLGEVYICKNCQANI